jgi:hypothetical protein
MSVELAEKQRRAVCVVETALLNVGISGRSVCVVVDQWTPSYSGHGGDNANVGVFVSAPIGADIEPYFVTGKTIVEAVRNMIDSIKGKANGAKPVVSESAPF